MSRRLAALRRSLDAMPSPVEDRPGLPLLGLPRPAPGRGRADVRRAWHLAPRGTAALRAHAKALRDAVAARAGVGPLAEVERRDRRTIAALAAGDADRFWGEIRENAEDLRWCGTSALYAFVRATRPGRGTLLRYEQWNIDPASVVSFAALAFGGGAAAAGEGGA